MIRTARRLMAGLAYVPIEHRPIPTTKHYLEGQVYEGP
jgi:hypothetical protein